MQNLKPAPSASPPQQQQQQQKRQSPSPAALLRDKDPAPTYEHSQEAWCDALLSSDAFPWLWDLAADTVREKQRAGTWDWERLVRALAQVTIHEPRDETLRLPLGLRNRRRIWRLLEEARLDDVAGPAEAAWR